MSLVKYISYLKAKKYDYYLLFAACYLHDISMINIARPEDLYTDKEKTDELLTWFMIENNKKKNKGETIELLHSVYTKIENFFEEKIRSKHPDDSAKYIRNRNELFFIDCSTREIISEISNSHGYDTKDIYYLKGTGSGKLYSEKKDKILIRFADLLDISKYRVSKPILDYNIKNMPSVSAFHWVSHLYTEKHRITLEYPHSESIGDIIDEKIIITIYVGYNNKTRVMKSTKCIGVSKKTKDIDNGFEIVTTDEGGCDNCDCVCAWFCYKNKYLINEIKAMNEYLKQIPDDQRLFNTEIILRVKFSNIDYIPEEYNKLITRETINNA